MTQQTLSKLSDVPQSIISRIEEGKIKEPSYNTMKKIFEFLDNYDQKIKLPKVDVVYEPRANELMNPRVISVKPYDRIKDAWDVMRRHNFSQLPVVDDKGRPLGSILEGSLPLSTTKEEFEKMQVEEVMADPFFIVGKDTGLSRIAVVLRHEQAVLVIDKGRIAGIITRYDLMDNAYKKASHRLK